MSDKKERFTNEAVGFLEVYGLVAAFVAADAACKAANVTIDSFAKNKPANAAALSVPLIMLVNIRGSISDVITALDAGEQAANSISGVVTKHFIARPEEDTQKLIALSAI